MADEQDVKQDSSPELEAALEGSAPSQDQQTPETQAGIAEQPETQEQEQQPEEEQRVPYQRFKDVNDEKNWYKQQLEGQLQRQPVQQPIQQPQPQDPYAGKSPEERVFWQEIDQRAERRARQIVETEIKPVIEAGRMEMAKMSVAQFRQQYPDVKANSPEEIQIAQKIQFGYAPDDAYKTVMWNKKMSEAQSKGTKTTQQRIQQKKQANVETSPGVSQSSQSPPKETFREEADRRMREAESQGAQFS